MKLQFNEQGSQPTKVFIWLYKMKIRLNFKVVYDAEFI